MYNPDNEQIQAVIISNDMIESLEELSLIINDETLGVTIKPLSIYCQKTGHEIGARNENSIFSLVKNCGKNTLLPTLYNSPGVNVHPQWINTNETALDNLMQSDPIGYACYCFGLITAQFYQSAKNQNKKLQPWSERYWAMARANALLHARGVADLDTLNLELNRVVTFMPDSTSYLFRRIRKMAHTPDMLAMLHCTGELIGILKEATNKALDSIGRTEDYIKKTRFVDYALTPADMARGPSNVRKQRVSERSVKEASMFAALNDMFKNAGLEGMGIFENKSKPADFTKFRSAAKMREDAQLAALEELGNLDLDDIVADNDEDDNTVEVRKLALPIHHEEQEPSEHIAISDMRNSISSMEEILEIKKSENAEKEQISQSMERIAAEISKKIEKVTVIIEIPAPIEPKKKMSILEAFQARKKGL